jgi:hypothetical protein
MLIAIPILAFELTLLWFGTWGDSLQDTYSSIIFLGFSAEIGVFLLPDVQKKRLTSTGVAAFCVYSFCILTIPFIPSYSRGFSIGFSLAVVADTSFKGIYVTSHFLPSLLGLKKAKARQEPKEQDTDRKKDIWNAIKKWVDLPITRFRDKQDTLPLAEKPPELADEIEECFRKNYQSIYANLEKLRQEYLEWKNTDSSKKFTTYEDGKPVINFTYTQKWDDLKARDLTRLHSQLVEQIKSEILAKYHSRLKC